MNRRVGWLELWTGLSGDMFLGALLDAGWRLEALRAGIGLLGIEGISITEERRNHRGLTGVGIRVEGPDDSPHRGCREILGIIESSGLPEPVRQAAAGVFTLLGTAESRIHGVPLEAVHFHEVGAVDSIVDIVGVALGLHELGVEEVLCGPVPIGGGSFEMSHGRLPVPAPATALLLEGWPVRPSQEEGEFFTPTAAALLRFFASPAGGIPSMRVDRVGYGAGTRPHPARPNLVRLWIGVETTPPQRRVSPGSAGTGQETGAGDELGTDAELGLVSVLETQMDDADPRWLAILCSRLLEEGALDVSRTAVLMKKGRLGTLLTVVARPAEADRLARRILEQTPTLGVRVRDERRWELPRRVEQVETPFGAVRVKRIGDPNHPRVTVEFEDLLRLSGEAGLDVKELERRILEALRDRWSSPQG